MLTFRNRDIADLRRPRGEIITFRRVDDRMPTEADLAAMVGLYRSDEVSASYRGSISDGKLTLAIVDGPDQVLTLTPVNRDIFESGPIVIKFIRNSRGRPIAFTYTTDRLKDLRFDLIPAGRSRRSG